MPLARAEGSARATEALLNAMNEGEAEMNGGEKGIRTLGTVSRTHAFQACSFNHSDISPIEWNQQLTGRRRALQKQTVT